MSSLYIDVHVNLGGNSVAVSLLNLSLLSLHYYLCFFFFFSFHFVSFVIYSALLCCTIIYICVFYKTEKENERKKFREYDRSTVVDYWVGGVGL